MLWKGDGSKCALACGAGRFFAPFSALLLTVVWATQCFAGLDMSLFGPKRYDRLKGAPSVYVDSFQRCEPSETALLRLVNGNGKESSITSGSVSINGAVVIAEKEFKQQTAVMEKTVTLRQLNELRVELKSGGPQAPFVTVEVIGRNCDSTPPVISTLAPADGSLLNNPSPLISARFSDENGGSGIAAGSIRLEVDGVDVTAKSTITSGEISYIPAAPLSEGGHTVLISVADNGGNLASKTWAFTTDTVAPSFSVTSHADGAFLNIPVILLSGTVDDPLASVRVNGVSAQVSGGTFSLSNVTLVEGANTISLQASDLAGNTSSSSLLLNLDTVKPTLSVTSPLADALVTTAAITVSGVVSEPVGSITVNGIVVTENNGAFTTPITLTEGLNTITVKAVDRAGNTGEVTVPVTLDTTPPALNVSFPTAQAYLNSPTIAVSGAADEPLSSLSVNGIPATVNGTSFSVPVSLVEGPNSLVIRASDRGGNISSVTIPVTLDTVPPVVTITSPQQGLLTAKKEVTVGGTVSEDVGSVTVGDRGAIVEGRAWSAVVPLAEGLNAVVVKAIDRGGNVGSAEVRVSVDSIAPASPNLTPLGSPTNRSPINFEGTAETGAVVRLAAGGVTIGTAAADAAGRFTFSGITLQEGANSFTATAMDTTGNESVPSPPLEVVFDSVPPVIAVTSPADNQFFSAPQVHVTGSANEPLGSLTLNGQTVQVTGLSFDEIVTLTPGLNNITITAADLAGNAATTSIVATLDSTPPTVTITSPVGGSLTRYSQVRITGAISKPNTTVTLNGLPITLADQKFDPQYMLQDGDNTLVIEATDQAGNKGSRTIVITLDATAPVLSLQAPAEAAAGAGISIGVTGADNRGLALVELKADGVPIWSGNAEFGGTENVSFRLSPTLDAGAEVVFQVRGVDAAGNEGSAIARTRIVQAAMGPGYIRGKVLEDSRGLALEGATVAITDSKGEVRTLTTPYDGGYFAEVPSGTALVRIEKAGYTPVERVVPVLPEQKAAVLDARLTKIAATGNAPGDVASVGAGAAVTIPPDAFAAPAEMRLTPVSNQGGEGVFPYGWSPLSIIDLRLFDQQDGAELEDTFSTPASARFLLPKQVAAMADGFPSLVVAAYDPAGHSWVVKALPAVSSDRLGAVAEISGPGQYALLAADQASTSGIDPGNAVPSMSMTTPDYTGVAAEGKVLPQASPPSVGLRAAGEILLQGKEGAIPAPAFVSGLVLNARINEQFDLKSGDRVLPPEYVQDLVLYRYPCVTNISAGAIAALSGGLRTTFPVSPSRDYTIVELLAGKVGIDITPPDTTNSGVMVGPDGGRLVDADGNILVIPQGALSQTTPVSTKNVAASVAVGADFTLLKSVEVNLTRQALASSATLSIPAQAGLDVSLPLVVAKQIDVKGVAKLKLVAMAKQSGSFINSDITADGIMLSGITTSGTYYFLQAKGQIGFVTGTVTDTGSAPFTGALVKTDSGSLVDLSSATGTYLVAAPVAPFTATALDLYKNDEVRGSAAITAANQIVTLDLKIEKIPPVVVSVSPANGSGNIQPNVPVVVTFSKAMDKTTITNATLVIRDSDGTTVPGVFTFSIDGKTVTFTPADLLKSEKSYTVTVSGGVRDIQGYNLPAPETSGFTVRKTTPPPMPAAGSITATFPDADGFVAITATQGSAAPTDTVLLINDVSGEITSVKPATNGSFSGKIRAQLGDEIKVVLMDYSVNKTLVSYITYKSDDGRYLVTAKGGKLEGEGGSILDVPEGALVGPTLMKVTRVSEDQLPHPVPQGSKYVGAVNIDTGGFDFNKEVKLSIPVPADMPADVQPFLAKPIELTNADGTVEKVYQVIDSTKIINGRITTASPPFDGVAQCGIFVMVYMEAPIGVDVTVAGVAFRELDGLPGYTLGADQPIRGAVIRSPYAVNFVSLTNDEGHYATFGFTQPGACRNFPLTAIHPQTMNKVTSNVLTCYAPYIVNDFNFRLADKETILPDKTPPVIDLNVAVVPGQAGDPRIIAGTVLAGTELQLPIAITDLQMGTATLSIKLASDTIAAILAQAGQGLVGGVTRYVYTAEFPEPWKGAQPYYFKPIQEGSYTITVEATDAAGNRSSRSVTVRAVADGASLGSGREGAPTVDSIVPADKSVDIMVTAPVIVWFSEPVENVTAATFKLIDVTTGTEVPATVQAGLEGGRMQAVLTPLGNLFYSRSYRIRLTGNIVDSFPNADGQKLPLVPVTATFTTKIPKGYDLTDGAFTGRDIALYTYTDAEGTFTNAYLTAGSQGWRIIDVTDPTAPYTLYPPAGQTFPTGFEYRSLAVDQDLKLLGITQNITPAEWGNQYGYVRFYDLGADPDNPPLVAQEKLAEAYSGIPGRISIMGGNAYVATVNAGLQVINIETAKTNFNTAQRSDGSSIIGVFDSVGLGYGQPSDIVTYGSTKAILTTTSGEFLPLDVSQPTPQLMSRFGSDYHIFRAAVAADFSYQGQNNVLESGDIAVVGTREGRVLTINLTDPYNPAIMGITRDPAKDPATDPNKGELVTFVQELSVSRDAGLAFVTTMNSIQVIDIKDPLHPRLLNTFAGLPTGALDADGNPIISPLGQLPAIVEKGGWVYLASQSKGLQVLDLDPHYLKVIPSPIVLASGINGVALADVPMDYDVYPDKGFIPVAAYLAVYEDGSASEIWKDKILLQGRSSTTFKATQNGRIFDIKKKYEAAIRIIDGKGVVFEGQRYRIPLQWPILSTDYNHNGTIDDTDRLSAKNGEVFRFWANDDDDSGETSGTDIPDSGKNGTDGKVNGIRDLIDFFPVHLDLKDLSTNFDPKSHVFSLRCDKNNVNMANAPVDLFADRSGTYLTGGETDLAPVPQLGSAPTRTITKEGIALSSLFVNRAKELNNQNAGVILLEGRTAGTCNLTLQVTLKGELVFTSKPLEIKLSGVEDMFRHVNMSKDGVVDVKDADFLSSYQLSVGSKYGVPDRIWLANPPNSEGGSNIVFVHGYSVNGNQARGWHAEMFKRLYWSGSKAKFWGVTWYGWDSQFSGFSPDYWRNVRHALKTGQSAHFSALLESLQGNVTVVAHSLGNMLVSSAIKDGNVKFDKYIMLNAAVPSEAIYSAEKIATVMIPETWSGYKPTLMSAEWHTRFEDSRSELTWRDRMASGQTSKYFNFYSPGEDVLSGVWRVQEKVKGTLNLFGIDYGGWGFNLDDYKPIPPSCEGCYDGEDRWSATRANAIIDGELKSKPFFRRGGPIEDLVVPGVIDPSIVTKYKDRVLAEAFPALTPAVGMKAALGLAEASNLDMQARYKTEKNGIIYWPREKENWRHSDVKEIAYVFVYPLYYQLVVTGGLNK